MVGVMTPTAEQIETLKRNFQTGVTGDDIGWEDLRIGRTSIIATRDSLDYYRQAAKQSWHESSPCCEMEGGLFWQRIQTVKGNQRVALAVLDCGSFRICLSMSPTIEIPAALTYWTADDVANCCTFGGTVDERNSLRAKLNGFTNLAVNPTPFGGDGSGGTVEEPAGRLDLSNDDKIGHWWGALSEFDQHMIAGAPEAYPGD